MTFWSSVAQAQESNTDISSSTTISDITVAPSNVLNRAVGTDLLPRVEPKPANHIISQTALRGMYVSFAALQVMDVQSTFRALENGAREGNPVMGGFVSNRGALLAMKAGITAATILFAERAAKKNRVGVIVVMAALNSVYATVVAHNYHVADQMANRR